jgi:4-amino-4-deoxy-L-arabinose transferase-like glycosyltransferase
MLKRINNPYLLLLSAIVLFDAYLRLWKLPHLFLWINDYDEGAYSQGGRFIANGFLPYRDFTLVHPPFYDLVLGFIYKVFGYNFLYGRYFSVLLSFACIVLVFIIIKKVYNPLAGLVAALLFTIFPGFYSAWYRAVQEPLCIFLILSALFFAADYIKTRKNKNLLLFSGLCLGLTAATKYTFIPAVVGFMIAFAMILTEWEWRNIPTYFSGLLKREFWLLVAGIVTGFFGIVGYFLIKTPQQFITQTISSQIEYRIGNKPESFIQKIANLPSGLHQILVFSRGSFAATISTICVLIGFILCAILFFKKSRTKTDIFFLAMTVISLLLCSFFNPFGETRYFACFYVLVLLSIMTFIPEFNMKMLTKQINIRSVVTNKGAVLVGLLMSVFLTGTLILRTDYNFLNSTNLTYEEQSYKETIDYLEIVGAKKIYAVDPVIPALAKNLNSVLEFDTFGEIITMNGSADTYYQGLLDEGIDYAVVDPFSLLSITASGANIRQLIMDIQQHGVLVKSTAPNGVAILGTQIYKITKP